MTRKEVKLAKLALCSVLASKTKKQVSKLLPEKAKELGLSISQARRAWQNFRQEGDPDKAYKHGKKSGEFSAYESNIKWAEQNNSRYKRASRTMTTAEKISVLRDYFFSELTTVELFEKHNVGSVQFYDSILKELRVYGKVDNIQILTWNKHPKIKVEDVKRFNKYKTFKDKVDVVYYVQVKHLSKILEDYLVVPTQA
jgi:Sec-independent protein translocase protein TatA